MVSYQIAVLYFWSKYLEMIIFSIVTGLNYGKVWGVLKLNSIAGNFEFHDHGCDID